MSRASFSPPVQLSPSRYSVEPSLKIRATLIFLLIFSSTYSSPLFSMGFPSHQIVGYRLFSLNSGSNPPPTRDVGVAPQAAQLLSITDLRS